MSDVEKLDLGEDEEKRAEKEIQTQTDKYVAEIDQIGKNKEMELLQI